MLYCFLEQKKIPELAKGLGSGIKNFKKAVKEDEESTENVEKVEAKETKSEATATTTSADDKKSV